MDAPTRARGISMHAGVGTPYWVRATCWCTYLPVVRSVVCRDVGTPASGIPTYGGCIYLLLVDGGMDTSYWCMLHLPTGTTYLLVMYPT